MGDEPREQRFHEFLVELLEALCRRDALLLILEDFQWADVATRDFVRVLAQRLRRQRLAVMITYRPEQAHLRRREERSLGRDAGDPVSHVLADLRARARHLELGGLEPEPLRALLAGMGLGAPSAHVIDRASGNPLFARELFLARLDGRDRLSGTVEELLRLRLNGLTPAAHRLVVTAAVVGRPAGPALLARAAGLADDEERAVVREALECGVLVRPPGADRDALGFRHDILRELAYDDLPSHDCSELHRAVAEAMEARERRRARLSSRPTGLVRARASERRRRWCALPRNRAARTRSGTRSRSISGPCGSPTRRSGLRPGIEARFRAGRRTSDDSPASASLRSSSRQRR